MTDFSKAPEKMLKQSVLHEILTKKESSSEEKKYTGYGYHGGGRPRKDAEARRKTISISGTPSEIEQLKKLAEESGKNVSRFVLDSLVIHDN